jgi:hypothetical protein
MGAVHDPDEVNGTACAKFPPVAEEVANNTEVHVAVKVLVTLEVAFNLNSMSTKAADEENAVPPLVV